MWWAGASNIQDGVTIDLGLLNQVNVSKDQKITSVGGGARWEDVYLKLDAMNLAVAGGRVADVGVGGLTLGGGNNYFAPRFGFACDGVESFEAAFLLTHARDSADTVQDCPCIRKNRKCKCLQVSGSV